MALILNDQQQKDKNQQQPALGQPVAISPSAPANTQAAAPSQQPASSGRFTNLQKYVRANQGDNTAKTLGSKLEGQAGQVRSDIGQEQKTFGEQAQQGRIATEQEENQFKSVLGNAAGYQGPGFGKLLTGSYAGPTQLGNAPKLQQEAQSTQALGQAVGTAAGKQGLLTQFFNRPTYTAGQQKFDVGLLGQDKSGALQQAKARTAGLQNQVQGAQLGAIQQAEAFRLADEQRKQAAQQALESTVGGVGNQMSEAAAAQSARLRDIQNSIRNQLNTGVIGGNLAQELGINPDQEYYANPLDYIKFGSTDVSKEAVATPEQIARLQGLQKLAGGYQSGQLQGINFGQLGKGVSGPVYTPDKEAFQKAQEAGQQQVGQMREAIKNTQDAIAENEQKFAGLSPREQDFAIQAFQKAERGESIPDDWRYGVTPGTEEQTYQDSEGIHTIAAQPDQKIEQISPARMQELIDTVRQRQALGTSLKNAQNTLQSRYPSIKRFIRG